MGKPNNHVIKEIYTTEVTYNNNLVKINEFISHIITNKDTKNAKKALRAANITDKELEDFRDITQQLKTKSDKLQELFKEHENIAEYKGGWLDNNAAQIKTTMQEYYTLMGNNFAEYNNTRTKMENAKFLSPDKKNNPAFYEDIRKLGCTTEAALPSVLFTIIQRPMRYDMLFEAILKYKPIKLSLSGDDIKQTSDLRDFAKSGAKLTDSSEAHLEIIENLKILSNPTHEKKGLMAEIIAYNALTKANATIKNTATPAYLNPTYKGLAEKSNDAYKNYIDQKLDQYNKDNKLKLEDLITEIDHVKEPSDRQKRQLLNKYFGSKTTEKAAINNQFKQLQDFSKNHKNLQTSENKATPETAQPAAKSKKSNLISRLIKATTSSLSPKKANNTKPIINSQQHQKVPKVNHDNKQATTANKTQAPKKSIFSKFKK